MTSPPIDPMPPDALFVINRLTEYHRIADFCHRHAHRHALVLTTHRLFASEREMLVALLGPTQVSSCAFADVLDDEVMARIDDATTDELLRQREPHASFVTTFQTRTTFRKNETVHARLPTLPADTVIYADENLGVSWPYWQRRGARPLARPHFRQRLRQHPWVTAWSARRRARRLPTTAMWINDGPVRYLFTGQLRRLPIPTGTPTESTPFNRAEISRADFLATTIHDYWPAIHTLEKPVRIFTDGHLPSNYSRSYLDGYGEAEYVATDPMAAHWLRSHHKSVVPVPRFIRPPAWSPVTARAPLRTVVCLLNHAGDWSALINRSDTDILAETFTQLAATTADLQFVLRPHPGMEHSLHEGAGGMQRLALLISQSGVKNLTYSTKPLAADLENGDLFLSEYSATLLDAWRLGKPGIITNFTGRRSFMDDFAKLGFAQVHTPSALTAFITKIRGQPDAFIDQHNTAVARYNAALKTHLFT